MTISISLKDLLQKYDKGTVMEDGRVIECSSLGGATSKGDNRFVINIRYTDGSTETRYS